MHHLTAACGYHHGIRAEASEMGDSFSERRTNMKCTVKGCPGEYEDKSIVHTVHKGEQIFVFRHVPAEVCSVCGDTMLKPDTVRHLEQMLKTKTKPEELAPVYEYA
jgi:YgiT-type zinc finger domain-containing protein